MSLVADIAPLKEIQKFVWSQGDYERVPCEALPFDSSWFDCVLSCFAAMFAARPEVAAKEMFRVARPGGVVGLANWTPELRRASDADGRVVHAGAPGGRPSPVEWGQRSLGG